MSGGGGDEDLRLTVCALRSTLRLHGGQQALNDGLALCLPSAGREDVGSWGCGQLA